MPIVEDESVMNTKEMQAGAGWLAKRQSANMISEADIPCGGALLTTFSLLKGRIPVVILLLVPLLR